MSAPDGTNPRTSRKSFLKLPLTIIFYIYACHRIPLVVEELPPHCGVSSMTTLRHAPRPLMFATCWHVNLTKAGEKVQILPAALIDAEYNS
jgi:hypothetical protein